MIFKKLRNNFSLLIDSSRHVWTFELAYKLVAFAVIFPIVLFAINFLMKIAGVNYLTNEYIQRAMTHPVVIFAIFLAMGIFVFYCTYEMTYLSVCFETKRTSCNASVVDIFYNSYKVFKNVFKPRHVGLSIFYFISILASNVTVWFNVLYSETNTNLIKMYIIRNHWYIKAEVIFMFVIIYAIVIPGIYAMNICMMEGLGFREAYKKSARMVKKHPMGTISALVVYNLVMLAIIGITYVLISVFLVAGVKILNMAYLGNAIFLSALRTERLIIKCILVCVAIPLSFSAISHMYYKYTDVDDITFEFTDIQEGPAKRRKIIYSIVLTAAVVADAFYLIMTFNNNPFENVAIFHETKVMAHRGASTETPENTMAAFQKAIDDMADYIELDVQLTSDGEVIVMHDSNAYRTTGVDENIVNMTYKEVRRLDAGSWYSDEYKGEKVPGLREVLELAQGKIKLNIELKLAVVPLFVILYILFRVLNNHVHKLYLKNEDVELAEEIEEEREEQKKNTKKVLIYAVVLIVTGILLFVIGELLGNTLENLCNLFGVSEVIVGILLGFVTSLPELITFFEAQRHYKKVDDDMLGVVEATNNLLTSNILNLFAIQTVGILISSIILKV